MWGEKGDSEESGTRTRAAALAALVAGVAIALVFTRCGGDEYSVTAQFQNASALVPGNQVVIGAQPVGSVKEIRLAPDGQANVTFTVDEEFTPLRRGTVATVRWASLSSVANRQIQLTPPAEGIGEEIEDGGVLTQTETITDVEVDQFFNMLDDKTVKDFKRVIKGFATSYEGVSKQANRGYEYLNPLLYTGRRVFAELNHDQEALESLLVDGSRFAGALADRSRDLSELVHNLNLMMNAIGDRKLELSRAIALLPPFMRNANTAFVNLRAALDDLQPLVVAARPAAKELRPFLVQLRATARNAVPTVRDLSAIIRRPGDGNDLIELQRVQPALRDAAIGSGSPDCGPGPEDPQDLEVAADDDFTQGSFGEALCSLRNGHENLSFFRAYTPELVGWFDGLSHSGYVDAIGGVGRVELTLNTFSPTVSLFPDLTDPDSPVEQFDALSTGNVRRCPGSNERPLGEADPGDDSVPFTDGGALTDGHPGECDPTKVQPGP
jgi:phospholipid/cholesterol/gamma-HCH transport system substrate-binding protein